MKVRGVFPLCIILILFLGISSSFAQEYEDVIYLKNGEVRRGLIIEEIHAESVKLKSAYGEIFIIKMSEISRMTKEEKKSPVLASSDVAAKGSNLKLEGWYTYWGVGTATTRYTGDMKQLTGLSGTENSSTSFDAFGFYWPLKNKQTILGMVCNVSMDIYENPDSYFDEADQWVSSQFSLSAMHFFRAGIGKGPFFRADFGWGSLAATDDKDNSFLPEGGDTSGPAVLFGVGYGRPIGKGGTRILLNLNYALRPGINYYNGLDSGNIRVLGITLGGLF